MQIRKFGRAETQTTATGFGSWVIGGPDWAAGWGEQDYREPLDEIKRSLKLGVILIDTAAAHVPGHSEEIEACLEQGSRTMRRNP